MLASNDEKSYALDIKLYKNIDPEVKIQIRLDGNQYALRIDFLLAGVKLLGPHVRSVDGLKEEG